MTAPFAPQPSRIAWLILLGMVTTAVAMPFARRDDWLGWGAFTAIACFAFFLFAVLSFATTTTFIAWFRDRPDAKDEADVCKCYGEYFYQMEWDRDRFRIVTSLGQQVVDVSLPEVLDVIDPVDLFCEGIVSGRVGERMIPFPQLRRERAKLFRLLSNLARRDPRVRQEIETHRATLLRQGKRSLVLSLLAVAALVTLVITLPNPQRLNLVWLVAGVTYGIAWHWSLRRFHQSLAWLLGARHLSSLLAPTDSMHAGSR